MNATAAAIDKAASILKADNDDAELDERYEREREMEAMLRKYILDGQSQLFTYGGVVNALSTIARICEEQSKIEDDDYKKAAILIDECAAACDLRYSEEE